MNARQLAEWILKQPSDIQDGDVSSVAYGHPSGAKRVVAFRYKDGSGAGIYVESMGTHLRCTAGAEMNFVSVL